MTLTSLPLTTLACAAVLIGCGGAKATPSANSSVFSGSSPVAGAAVPVNSAPVATATITPYEPVEETTAFLLASADLAEDSDPTDVRYLSLAYLQTSGLTQAQLATTEKAVTKLINSLSWKNQSIAPVAIDANHAVLRVRLNDYGWTPAVWEMLTANHPAATSSTPGLASMVQATGATKPLIRAEWFVRNASVPPLYYQILSLPSSVTALTALLNVDLNGDIANGKVLRAGFANSQVSTNDRVIEQHPLASGFLWRTYEFSSNTGTRDIFSYPLGPGGNEGSNPISDAIVYITGGAASQPAPPPLSQFAAQAFTADGGEFLFTLPNGMLAFYVADGVGVRLDQVPDNARILVPGASCFNCHAGGPLNATDQVRAKTAQNATLPAAALAEVQKLYVDPAQLSGQITHRR